MEADTAQQAGQCLLRSVTGKDILTPLKTYTLQSWVTFPSLVEGSEKHHPLFLLQRFYRAPRKGETQICRQASNISRPIELSLGFPAQKSKQTLKTEKYPTAFRNLLDQLSATPLCLNGSPPFYFYFLSRASFIYKVTHLKNAPNPQITVAVPRHMIHNHNKVVWVLPTLFYIDTNSKD